MDMCRPMEEKQTAACRYFLASKCWRGRRTKVGVQGTPRWLPWQCSACRSFRRQLLFSAGLTRAIGCTGLDIFIPRRRPPLASRGTDEDSERWAVTAGSCLARTSLPCERRGRSNSGRQSGSCVVFLLGFGRVTFSLGFHAAFFGR